MSVFTCVVSRRAHPPHVAQSVGGRCNVYSRMAGSWWRPLALRSPLEATLKTSFFFILDFSGRDPATYNAKNTIDHAHLRNKRTRHRSQVGQNSGFELETVDACGSRGIVLMTLPNYKGPRTRLVSRALHPRLRAQLPQFATRRARQLHNSSTRRLTACGKFEHAHARQAWRHLRGFAVSVFWTREASRARFK